MATTAWPPRAGPRRRCRRGRHAAGPARRDPARTGDARCQQPRRRGRAAPGRHGPAVADRRASRRQRRGLAAGPARPGRRAPVTDRLRLRWPDPAPFVDRDGRPIRILAISDEPDPSLDSPATRAGLGPIDLIIGAGDLQPEYLSLHQRRLRRPAALRPREPRRRLGLGAHRAGAPAGADAGREARRRGRPAAHRLLRLADLQRPRTRSAASGMWNKAFRAWLRAARARPVLVVSHAPPRDVNDGDDLAHRGFTAFRWLTNRLQPPLWLHGHTALVRRGIDHRSVHEQWDAVLQLHRRDAHRARAARRRWMSRSRSAGPRSGAC